MDTTQFSFDAALNDLFWGIFKDVKATYKPPQHRCTVCGSLMAPCSSGIEQFCYHGVHRKYGFMFDPTRVCCPLCASDHEQRLPRRYSFEFGYVYLMRADCGYKIGRSIDPDVRRSAKERDIGQEVELLHTIKAPHVASAEKYLHYRYRDLRIDMPNGEQEWFNLSKREFDYIKSLSTIESWRLDNKKDSVIVKLPWQI